MKVGISKLLCAASLGVAALTAAPALAAVPPVQADGRALILIPLTLTKIQDLDFGSVIPSPVSGTVTIKASTGARTSAGGVTLAPGDPGFRAYFGGAGSPNQQVIITMDPPSQLINGTGDTIDVLALTLNGSAIRTIHPTDRTFFIGVGGSIQIAANQADGDYNALSTSLPITSRTRPPLATASARP
jgi:hypothetical protein